MLTIERLAGCIRSLCILESSTARYILDVYQCICVHFFVGCGFGCDLGTNPCCSQEKWGVE